MKDLLQKFKSHVIQISQNKDFIHHEWFIEYHLDIVEQIAMELCDFYTDADRDLVYLLVWLHDYGKIVNFDDQYQETLISGKQKLLEIGFDTDFVLRAISCVEIMDQKEILDISTQALEIQIISSADGCSHLVGPFFKFWWLENPDKSVKTLIQDNIYKHNKDWEKKVVLPEAQKAFKSRRKIFYETCGVFPDKFL